MLHSFVAPVIILAASICIASSCFLLSVVALSHTESLYSNTGLMNAKQIFSSARLLILNLRVRKRLNLVHAASVIWLVQSHVSEKVKPKCLCVDVHFNGILFIKRGGTPAHVLCYRLDFCIFLFVTPQKFDLKLTVILIPIILQQNNKTRIEATDGTCIFFNFLAKYRGVPR